MVDNINNRTGGRNEMKLLDSQNFKDFLSGNSCMRLF